MRSPELVIIGIDPGTQCTGYGVIRVCGQKHEAIDYGFIKTSPAMRLSERYAVLYDHLMVLIEKHRPDAVSVETQYVSKNPQSTIKLSIARGMVLLASAKNGVNVFEYSPSHAKKAVVGHGGGSKEQVQAMVKVLLGLKEIPEPNDVSDALAIAICHAHAAIYESWKGTLL